jgi:hypothetical protein
MTNAALVKSTVSFFKKLFSESGDVSSKRVVGFSTACLFALMVIWHLITKQVVQTDFIWASISLTAACFGLNAYISGKEIEKSKPVDKIEKEID